MLKSFYMDILRKELNDIYQSQNLNNEILNHKEINRCRNIAENLIHITNGCAVITDASCDHCYIFFGSICSILGISQHYPIEKNIASSDEDMIYNLIHPEDLVEKRMLEYEFFKFINPFTGSEKIHYQATCRIRIKSALKDYIFVDNTTQIICPTPNGKIWLILCTYSLSSDTRWYGTINPSIKNNHSGEIMTLSLNERRRQILTHREKEILLLMKQGKASKQIADILDISINTVNRHRQNILEKLSVANSIEAITAVESMNLW